MGPFWHFASRLLRRPGTLTLAMVMAFVSAGSLGGGLLAIPAVLDSILGEKAATLPELATKASAKLPFTIPKSFIDSLPVGRFDAVLWLLVGLAGLTVVGAVANFLHAYLSLTLSTELVADVRRDAFRHAIHLPLRALVGKTGDMLSRIVNDTNVLLNGLTSLTGKAVAQVTKTAFALGAAIYIEWRLTLVAALLAPVLYTVVRKLGKRIRRASRGAMQAHARMLAGATEALHGLRVVKVHTAERYELGRFSRHNRDVVREQLRARTARALASPLTEAITLLVLAALALIAAKTIIDGKVDPAHFIAALMALGVAGGSLKPLTSLVQEIQTSDAAALRLRELLDAPPEVPHTPERRESPPPRLARHARTITFDGVTFSYPESEAPAVADVSLEVHHGETVAFVGPNGSGKTTLLALIPRLFTPDSGRVLIDGTDIAGVNLSSLRRQIGAVTQEVVLFHTTIAENIAYGLAGVTRERVIAAARQAGADEFIRAKPGGYDAVVGEQGLTLSGGQRQKISIARAILRDPAILILDEATSMIDSESERQIGEALTAFSAGRTCLIVAHRMSTVARADRIVVMQAGRVIDSGRHDELLERCGLYRQLARTQLAAGAV